MTVTVYCLLKKLDARFRELQEELALAGDAAEATGVLMARQIVQAFIRDAESGPNQESENG